MFTASYDNSWFNFYFPGNWEAKGTRVGDQFETCLFQLERLSHAISKVPSGNCPMLSAWMHAVSPGWQSSRECSLSILPANVHTFCNKKLQEARLPALSSVFGFSFCLVGFFSLRKTCLKNPGILIAGTLREVQPYTVHRWIQLWQYLTAYEIL